MRISTFPKAVLCLAGAFLVLAAAAWAQKPAEDASNRAAGDDRDVSVKPGDDFYRYANGNWLARSVIPPGKQSYDTRAELTARVSEQVRDLIVEAATTTHPPKGSIPQKVGDYYASFMDEASIEAKGFAPLAEEMAAIAAITNKTSLSAYLGSTLNSEVDGLTANADHIFGVWINQGFEDADHNFPHLWQGGLGLPDRDSYTDPSSKMVELRAKYQTHIAAVLKLAGFVDTETSAERILSLETRVARTFAPDSDAADVFKAPLMGMIGTRHEIVYKARGHAFIAEYYADLEYNDDGSLIVTREHKAVDPVEAASRCLRAIAEGKTRSINGRDVQVAADSICVHSDTPNAVEVARAVRDALRSQPAN